MLGPMTNKVVIWVVAIIIILGAGYFIYKTYSGSQLAQQQQQAQQQASTTQPVVQARDVSVGTGAQAEPGSVVSVLYIGKLSDGTVFDSSEMHKDPKTGQVPPLTFQLGAQGLIAGFQIGVNGMKEGGERLLAVPPEFGYGAQDVKDQAGKVIIPANSTLVFDVKLVKVQASSTAATGAKKPQ